MELQQNPNFFRRWHRHIERNGAPALNIPYTWDVIKWKRLLGHRSRLWAIPLDGSESLIDPWWWDGASILTRNVICCPKTRVLAFSAIIIIFVLDGWPEANLDRRIQFPERVPGSFCQLIQSHAQCNDPKWWRHISSGRFYVGHQSERRKATSRGHVIIISGISR